MGPSKPYLLYATPTMIFFEGVGDEDEMAIFFGVHAFSGHRRACERLIGSSELPVGFGIRKGSNAIVSLREPWTLDKQSKSRPIECPRLAVLWKDLIFTVINFSLKHSNGSFRREC